MGPEHEQATTDDRQIPVTREMRDAYQRELSRRRGIEIQRHLEDEDHFRRQAEDRAVEVIEEIRQQHGIGWAIYASAFLGRGADSWRVDVCEAMR